MPASPQRSGAITPARTAVRQWRDSLVNLSGMNPLLNYRATRATIEVERRTMAEVHEAIGSSERTYLVGLRPPESDGPKLSDEAEALDELAAALVRDDQMIGNADRPSDLPVDKTQKDVDRALRALASQARREFVDKGIWTLYVGFGELAWQEANGDRRRSPLVLVPVELVAPGPRERRHLTFAEGDVVVNPALAIRLAGDFGLDLPNEETIIGALESAGIDAAVALFRDIRFPDGWEVRDLAVLRTFMFAKEAMYRDLLDHEDQIAESPLIKSLSGEVGAEKSPFLFEPHNDQTIDDVAPPEETPLVRDADSSQRAAIQAAIEGRSFTLDGPPGTGKSQTIANVIGALIARGKRVLFVSEKAVALQVVQSRLEQAGLGAFIFHLHSAKSSRKEVAAQLGAALTTEPVPPPGLGTAKLAQLRRDRRALTDYAVAANEVRRPLETSFHDVQGWHERTRTAHVAPSFEGDASTLTPESLHAIEAGIDDVVRRWDLHLQGASAPWFGLRHRGDVRYPLSQIAASSRAAEGIFSAVEHIGATFGIDSERDLGAVLAVVEAWQREPDWHQAAWLEHADLHGLASAADAHLSAVVDLEAAEQEAERAWLGTWAPSAGHYRGEIPDLDESLARIPGVSRESPADAVSATLTELTAARKALRELVDIVTSLADLIGASAPRNELEARAVIDAAACLLSDASPLVEWCYDPTALRDAQFAAARMHEAQQTLERAAAVAGETFSRRALETDLEALEKLASATRGFFKRFGADHRELRRALTEISSASWKIARDRLPDARGWSSAEATFSVEASAARDRLGRHVEESTRADSDLLARRFANASIAAQARLVDRDATSRVMSDSATQVNVSSTIASARIALQQWRARSAAWFGASSDAQDTLERLAERFQADEAVLRRWDALVDHQREQLDAGKTLEQHRAAALARLTYDAAQRAVLAAQQPVAPYLPATRGGGAASQQARSLSDGTRWAQGILLQAHGAGAGFTSEQLAALRSTDTPSDARATLEGRDRLVEEIVGWFDESQQPTLREKLTNLPAAGTYIGTLESTVEGIDDLFVLQRAVTDLREAGLGASLEHARDHRLLADDVSRLLRHTVYGGWLDAQLRTDRRLRGGKEIVDRDELVERFRAADRALAAQASSTIIDAGIHRRPRSAQGQTAIIRREAGKKRKHMPVRDLISEARDVILAMHPCFMMSPLAVSQFLPSAQLFDVVIFDEASQVLPGDAINCIYRGASLIAAGDQKQLPPTSFFEVSVGEPEDDEDDDLAKDYESILDLMKASGSFTAQSLRWHYRSRHEDLISFSNVSFYESRLITFPGAVGESADLGVNFFKVDGVYQRSGRRDNPIEAREVATRVLQHYSQRPGKSLGVVAFSSAQRDAIEAAVELARSERPELDAHFDEGQHEAFFVKSLEEVQGDERDVMIFSIGYGPDEHGKVYRNFGPLNRRGGERRLNVAVTRAKELVEVVSSMTAGDIGEVSGAGARHLKRYLDFAERGHAALEIELGPEGRGTDSPFEDAVIDAIRGFGYEVQSQVGTAGYRIDIGVKHPNQLGAFLAGIECDGAMYHSSRAARDRDRLRHEILEGLGWNLHRIWGTSWYRQPNREKERLRAYLEDLMQRPVVGRLTARSPERLEPTVVETVPSELRESPDWISDYELARVERIPDGYDLSETYNAFALVPFVEAVARIEAPMHLDVLLQRLREHTAYGRIGARIRQTVLRALNASTVEFDGEFIRHPASDRDYVRRGTEEYTRKIAEVPGEEMRRALTLLVDDAISISRTDLRAGAVEIFGWRRMGSDIRDRIDQEIQMLVDDGRLEETPAGLRGADRRA